MAAAFQALPVPPGGSGRGLQKMEEPEVRLGESCDGCGIYVEPMVGRTKSLVNLSRPYAF